MGDGLTWISLSLAKGKAIRNCIVLKAGGGGRGAAATPDSALAHSMASWQDPLPVEGAALRVSLALLHLLLPTMSKGVCGPDEQGMHNR